MFLYQIGARSEQTEVIRLFRRQTGQSIGGDQCQILNDIRQNKFHVCWTRASRNNGFYFVQQIFIWQQPKASGDRSEWIRPWGIWWSSCQIGNRYFDFKEEMKWKLSLLHLQDLIKVIKNVFYSFWISHFVLELFKFVWNVNEITSDVKLCTDHLELLLKSCTSLRLINNTWSCHIQRVHKHFICKVLSDLID